MSYLIEQTRTEYRPDAPDPRTRAVPDSLLLPETGGDMIQGGYGDEKEVRRIGED